MQETERTDIAALIDRHDAAWNAQDLDAIASLHDDDRVRRTTTRARRWRARRPYEHHIAAIFARWPTFASSAARCASATTSP